MARMLETVAPVRASASFSSDAKARHTSAGEANHSIRVDGDGPVPGGGRGEVGERTQVIVTVEELAPLRGVRPLEGRAVIGRAQFQLEQLAGRQERNVERRAREPHARQVGLDAL